MRLDFFPATDLIPEQSVFDQRLGSLWAPYQTVKQGDLSSPKMFVHQGVCLVPAMCPDPISCWMLSRLSATSNGSWCNPFPNNCYFSGHIEGTRRPLDALCLTMPGPDLDQPGPASLKRHRALLCLIGLLRRTRSIRLCTAVSSHGAAFFGTL